MIGLGIKFQYICSIDLQARILSNIKNCDFFQSQILTSGTANLSADKHLAHVRQYLKSPAFTLYLRGGKDTHKCVPGKSKAAPHHEGGAAFGRMAGIQTNLIWKKSWLGSPVKWNIKALWCCHVMSNVVLLLFQLVWKTSGMGKKKIAVEVELKPRCWNCHHIRRDQTVCVAVLKKIAKIRLHQWANWPRSWGDSCSGAVTATLHLAESVNTETKYVNVYRFFFVVVVFLGRSNFRGRNHPLEFVFARPGKKNNKGCWFTLTSCPIGYARPEGLRMRHRWN